MIRCRLVELSRNTRGQSVRTERNISGEELTLGRSPESSIHLADPRTNQLCAVIKKVGDGHLEMDGEGTLLSINGTYEHKVLLNQGMQIFIGPYQLTVEQIDTDSSLTLAVELIHALPEGSPTERHLESRSITDLGYSKRKLTLWFSGTMILLFLVIPIDQLSIPGIRGLFDSIRFSPMKFLDTGTIDSGHKSLRDDCLKCHDSPFREVRNETCLGCHSATGWHVTDQKLNARINGLSGCNTCHFEHQGNHMLALQGDQECIACHSKIHTLFKETNLPVVSDFTKDHPAFRLSINPGLGESAARRVSQAQKVHIKENSGLKFPHDQHIGTVQVPGHMWEVQQLECQSCHQPNDTGTGFKPVSMKAHCFNCHQDQFDFPVLPKEFAKLPHGSSEMLYIFLQSNYQDIAFKTKKSGEWIKQQMGIAATKLSSTSGCTYCHVVQPPKDLKTFIKVVPPNLTSNWLAPSLFPHDKHKTQKCTACHNIEHSTSSHDVAIPDIENCKKCHTGNSSNSGKIQSECHTCHKFHAFNRTQYQPASRHP